MVVCLGCECCLAYAGLLSLVTGACLGPTVTFGLDLAVLSFVLVAVTSLRVGLSVTGPGACLRVGGVAAFITRPPRITWFQPGPRLSCSADGSTYFAFGALAVTLALLRSTGALFASAALASFHFVKPR
jgi:hypothetical protein